MLTSPLFGTVSSTVNGTGGLKPRSEQQSETDDEKSYGFRTGAAIELALYHSLGALSWGQNRPTNSPEEAKCSKLR